MESQPGNELVLLVEKTDNGFSLRSPSVGLFSCALVRGRVVQAGEAAGVLRTLEKSSSLIIPAGVAGRISSNRPEAVQAPVEYGEQLYSIEHLDGDALEQATQAADASQDVEAGHLALRSTHAGRFWHRPAPGAPAFAEPGDILEEGSPVGLVEVMKTFTRVHYRAGNDLPARARLIRMVPGDGDEVSEGAVLLELEAAP